jgi:hypothetical protein
MGVILHAIILMGVIFIGVPEAAPAVSLFATPLIVK